MSNNRINKVAIVGASGHLASHIVPELLKTGKHSVTALSRPESKATYPTGVNVALVDYSNEESIVSALRGHDFLIITMPSMQAATLHPKIVAAAAKAGIPYIMPNSYSYDIENERLNNDWLYGPPSLKAVKEVADSGASYIALCCGYWFEWSLSGGLDCYGFDIKERKAILFDDGKAKINTSTLERCGKAVAALLSLPVSKEGSGPALEDWKNKGLYVSSFLVSQREMLDSLHRALGDTDKDWTIEYQSSEERVKAGIADMKKGDFRGFIKGMYSRNFYPNGDGDYETSKGLDNAKLGLDEKEDLDATVKWVAEKKVAGEMVYDVHG